MISQNELTKNRFKYVHILLKNVDYKDNLGEIFKNPEKLKAIYNFLNYGGLEILCLFREDKFIIRPDVLTKDDGSQDTTLERYLTKAERLGLIQEIDKESERYGKILLDLERKSGQWKIPTIYTLTKIGEQLREDAYKLDKLLI